MLPNIRLSGSTNDSIGDFLAVSSASAARSAAATSVAAANRSFAPNVSSSGWGPMPTSSGSASFASTVGSGGQSRNLADHVKESSGWSQQPSSSSMPWAAAVKAPIDQHHQHALLQHHSAALAAAASLAAANAFGDSGNTIGSWSSPETSSLARSGWNADGSMKSDGVPDDGTAIWGNPSAKKTGIDWTEKESLSNPPQSNNNSEKRIQKPEPVISSINGTEAWGAPAIGNSNNLNDGVSKLNNSQQLANLSENSGNNYVGKTSTINNEPLSWGELSSLQQATTKNENSSPSSDSLWNHLTPSNDADLKSKTSADWLSSGVSANNSANRIDGLNKQLEATNIFNGDSTSSASMVTKNSSSITSNNLNLDNNGRQSSMLGGNSSAGTIGASLVGGNTASNAINDLKQQMSANFSSSDLLEPSPNRQPQANVLSSNNQSQSQLSAYSLGVTPSRELLKQMVHQIQLAVQAGHLNAHILNQPLSTPTLQLVYTLLQQIKLLQNCQELQQRTQALNKPGDVANNAAQQNNWKLQIARIQQNISLLQKAITQQQGALTKSESIVESNLKQQQHAANNSSYNNSYANISKLSTNMKVPSNNTNMSNTIGNSNNLDSFRRSSLIDTLSNSNSDQLRSDAQVRFEANANLDKNLSPILQSSSLNNILNNKQQNDFSKAQSFTNNQNANQQSKNNSLASTTQASTSPAAAAWLAFSQGDLGSIQGGSSGGGGWSRLSSNEQPHFSNGLLSDLSVAKAWRGAPFLSSDGRDNATNAATSVSSSMTPGSNLTRPNSASNSSKQMSENDIINRDPSLFYDWTSNQTSDSMKRNSDAVSSSSSFSPAIGGLSLQSNPWLFPPTSSNSLNIGNSGLDNLIGGNRNDAKNKLDNGDTDKIRVGSDHLGFLGSNNTTCNAPRALYDWSDLTSAATSLQFNNDNSIVRNKQTATSCSASNAPGSRPGPPPGLMSNLGLLGTSSVNEISTILESDSSKLADHNEAQHMPSHESSSSLWSGAWFD